MSKTTEVLHLGTNVFLVPARRRLLFWDHWNNGADNFFHLISIPPENIPLIVAGYGGEFYQLTAAELAGRQYATTEHPLTGETSRAVLHVAPQVDPRSRAIVGHGRDTHFLVNLQTRVGARAPILYQFGYYARNEARAIVEFLEDQPDLLTLPGAV